MPNAKRHWVKDAVADAVAVLIKSKTFKGMIQKDDQIVKDVTVAEIKGDLHTVRVVTQRAGVHYFEVKVTEKY